MPMINGENKVCFGLDLRLGGKELMEIAGYKFKKLDEFEIRIESPNGESWRIKNVDKQHGFESFLWDMAEAIISNHII